MELPDDVYENLRRQAEETGKTLEEFLAARLAQNMQGSQDALLQLAGVLNSELADLAERHDYYIGQRVAQLKPDAGT